MLSPELADEGKVRLLPDSLPSASEVFAALPAPRPDDEALRASIRAMRAQDGLLLGVLDDDPTGSQSVHDVQVVTVLHEDACQAALAASAGTCFVLTNTRSLDEPAAVELTMRAARTLLAIAGRRGARIQLISRSDSTLRGHVLAEVAALQAARREALGSGFDAVLLVPAFLEAGRMTAADIQWARTGGGLVPAGQTEFARDPVFGYRASDLRDFLAEKSGGGIEASAVASIGLADIRLGGPARVRQLLAGMRNGGWAVINATEYSDLETVACAVLQAERAGQSFLFRTGPSFVRALLGQPPRAPLRGADIWPAGRRAGHGLIVVGSHVGQTSRQLAALRALGGTVEVELDAAAVVSGGSDVVEAAERRVADALLTGAPGRSDVLLYTSRTVLADGGSGGGGSGGAGSGHGEGDLEIGRQISAALSGIAAAALAARPAWVVAKGGITAHDVALHGLGIRRAEVAGQLFPGMISVLHPVDAAPAAIGLPYVVFAGNVGDDQALAQVVAILHGSQDS
ncbi:MAG: four-carbon acid sugar kinase family protein [Streptosporangiaceae bacterium]|jgi:uncharacterized protein YgbK (DUF1537 family)